MGKSKTHGYTHLPLTDDGYEKHRLTSFFIVVFAGWMYNSSTLEDTILFFIPGKTSMTSLICCKRLFDARCPVEKIDTHMPGHAINKHATNILTAVVLPKRLEIGKGIE